MRRALLVVALSVVATLVVPAQAGAAGPYTVTLTSPTPPAGATVFTWTVTGVAPDPRRDITSVELSGCWTAAQVATVEARDVTNAPLRARVRKGGRTAGDIEVSSLGDRRLPATIAVTFKTQFGSSATAATATVEAGNGGHATSSTTEVGGPTCQPTYRLELSAGPGGRATASPSAPSYAAGAQVSISAVPDAAYEFSGWTVDGTPAGLANPLQLTMNADHTVVANFESTGPPPDLVAPPLDPSVPTSVFDATSFLYNGPGAVQIGVAPGTIEPHRVAVLRGKVLTAGRQPLSGVRVTVLDHPEFGRTQSRSDGMFDLAVNGGGRLTVDYAKEGFIPAQRHVNAPWQDFASLPDVVLVAYDAQVTTVDLASPAPTQVARGTAVTDESGTRQATLLFSQGTTATMTMPDGSTQPLTGLDVRATELTVGEPGRDAMPGDLPATSGYTYAAELSVDQAVASGATGVRFSQPVVSYVENFLGFQVGTDLPVGYYDRAQAAWLPSDDGRIIAVVGETDGRADIDVNGDGAADEAATLGQLGIDDAERERLAGLYEPDQSLWRTPITHFSTWDYNWPYRPPPGATGPSGGQPRRRGGADGDCPTGGSVISCLGQGLGESIDIVGTPFTLNYQSNRTPGRKPGLVVPLSGETVPSSLKRIEVEVQVAGQVYTDSFAPTAGASLDFVWDGNDAYGRTVQGAQPVSVRKEYVYDAFYTTPAELEQSFAQFGDALTAVPARGEVTIGDRWDGDLGTLNGQASGLGGWTLNVHQSYDPVSGTLLDGTGGQTSATSVDRVIETFAGTGENGSTGDGGPATEAQVIAGPLVVGPDGTLYLGENSHRVRKVGPDGIITTIAGTGVQGFSGDGGPATQATLSFPTSLALGPDGSLYVGEVGNDRVRRIAPDGTITTFAGGGSQLGEGVRATDARLEVLQGVAVGPDGSVYLAELFKGRIRRVSPDGLITTVAGGGVSSPGDGGPAIRARLTEPRALAFAPDGTLFVSERGNVPRVRRIGTDGIITTYAGGGTSTADGGQATDVALGPPTMNGLAVGPEGLYIVDHLKHKLRLVRSDGLISRVAGTGVGGFAGDGGPAAAALIGDTEGVARAPDGGIFISDAFTRFSQSVNNRVRKITPVTPSLNAGHALIPSPGGQQLYQFDEHGRHARTLHALTSAVMFQFSYDPAGRLSAITDVDGNVTTIERAPDGKPTAIVAPGGQRTTLAVNDDGYLVRAANPANEAVTFAYHAGGLLASMTEPGGGVHRYTYDDLGGLVRDEDPAGGVKILTRTELDDGHRVVVRTPLGLESTYESHQTWFGSEHVTTDPAGARTENRDYTAAGRQEITYPDGRVVEIVRGPDPRFGMQAPLTTSMSLRTAGGLEQNLVVTRSVILANPGDPLSLQSQTDTSTLNGLTSTQTFDAATRTLTARTPEGRESSMTFDARAHVVAKRAGEGVDPVVLNYGPTGLLVQVDFGAERWTYGYDSRRRPVSRRNTSGGITTYTYDDADRVLSTRAPNGAMYRTRYDANGNRVAMIMPNGAEHTMTYNAVNLMSGYQAPANPLESWTFDLDRRLTGHTRPGGESEVRTFDPGGRFAGTSSTEATVAMAYGDPTERPSSSLRAPSGAGETADLAFSYDGALTTAIDFRGPASVGRYTYTYDDNFLLTRSVLDSGGQSFTFDVHWDRDGLVTAFGPFTWARTGPGGAVGQISDGTAVFEQGYDGLARPTDRRVSVAGNERYRAQSTYDSVGVISQKVETMGGTGHTFEYLYDVNQQLIEVKRDGATVERYAYDANANRTSRQLGSDPAEGAVYDAQDRLVSRGGLAYQVNEDGFLVSRGTDAFTYGTQGQMVSAHVGDKVVNYSYDGLGRRVAKEVNAPGGQSRVEYLYGEPADAVRVTAVRADGELTVLFYDDAGSLYAFERAGTRFYVGSDQLGSPRLVTTASGQVVKAIEYDAYGSVVSDSDPGFFLPIGFAGGIADPETALVHFGFRDYEPASGRWTARDPVLFGGGQANLYAYVGNSPVTFRDPLGLICVGLSAYRFGGGGVKICFDNQGLTGCGEIGFGLGGGFEADLAGKGGPKDAIVGEIGVECGGFALGGTVQFNVCGDWKKPEFGKPEFTPKCQFIYNDFCGNKVTSDGGVPNLNDLKPECNAGGKLVWERCRRLPFGD